MHIARASLALLLCSAAARSQEIEPLIDRPATLPRGALELTLNGNYSNWGGSTLGLTGSVSGETLAFGADFGTTDEVQLGIAVAFPIDPGAGFGSIVGSAAFAVQRNLAVRLDAGFERIGINGSTGTVNVDHTNRFFGGIGAALKAPISPTLAFVSGQTGAIRFGQFTNVGTSGTGLYLGASGLSESSSDLLVVSGGDNNSSTNIGVNLPIGLLLQPDPRFAVTLLTGYSAVISTAGSAQALHYIPLGIEAVLSAAPALDLGLRFFLDGLVTQTGGNSSGNPGYFDLRAVLFWFRVHV
ncbi:MAG TPA: hypothetical protein VFA79_16745 [Myxococcales bacterium]|nr:hypothetical protein [Myxococcales bacterium]